MDIREIVEIEGAGPVLFERSRLARRLNITVKPVKGVRVAVPRGMSLKKAVEIVQPRSGWILKHRGKLELQQEEYQKRLLHLPPINVTESKERLKSRLREMADEHGFSYNRVFIRNQRTRWGSCSSKNNINLNIKLVRLPDELIDYVLLHELVHTKIKNHGAQFWEKLDFFLGDARAIDKKLNQYRIVFL